MSWIPHQPRPNQPRDEPFEEPAPAVSNRALATRALVPAILPIALQPSALSPTSMSGPVIGSTAPDAITLGRYRDFSSGAIGPRIRYGGDAGVMLWGRNGSGKDTKIIIPNLLQAEGLSIFCVDVKGEASAVTLPWRRELASREGGRVIVINPENVLVDVYPDMKSDGFNPLIALDPDQPSFSTSCSYIADAIITIEGNESGNAKHFIESAKAMLHACIMWEAICAKAEQRVPIMANVRLLICTATAYDPDERRHTGWPDLAEQMLASGNAALANLASQFSVWNNEKEGIASDAKRQTVMFDDHAYAADLMKGTFDFREMKERPTTVMLILPPLSMRRQAAYLRMVVDTALRAVLRERKQHEPKCLFILNEFRTMGRLDVLSDVWGVVRGYGVQLMPVLQSYQQLITLYGPNEAKTFVEQAGVLASFGANEMDTAEFLSKRCGTVTRVMPGYNEGSSHGGHNVNASSGLSYGLHSFPVVTPQDAYDLRDGEMLQFAAGMSKFISAYAPSYWDIDQCYQRARRNPLHRPRRYG